MHLSVQPLKGASLRSHTDESTTIFWVKSTGIINNDAVVTVLRHQDHSCATNINITWAHHSMTIGCSAARGGPRMPTFDTVKCLLSRQHCIDTHHFSSTCLFIFFFCMFLHQSSAYFCIENAGFEPAFPPLLSRAMRYVIYGANTLCPVFVRFQF